MIQFSRVGHSRSANDDHLHREVERRLFEGVHWILDGHDVFLRDGQRTARDSKTVAIGVQPCPGGVRETCAKPFTVFGSDRNQLQGKRIDHDNQFNDRPKFLPG